MKKSLIIAAIFMLAASVVHAEQKSEYMEFFNKNLELANNFDVAVAELYSDDAIVTALRLMSDGTKQTLTLDGKKWKELIIATADVAKKRGDKSTFSNIKIIEGNGRAKITATRYSLLKCFEDDLFYMVVERNEDGDLEIVEEFTQSPYYNNCEGGAGNDLALMLEGIVKVYEKQLPIMADADTKLYAITSSGTTLSYHYELINYASTDLDAEVLRQNFEPIFISQTCTMQNLKSVIEKNGTVAFQYMGNDKTEIFTISVDGKACN